MLILHNHGLSPGPFAKGCKRLLHSLHSDGLWVVECTIDLLVLWKVAQCLNLMIWLPKASISIYPSFHPCPGPQNGSSFLKGRQWIWPLAQRSVRAPFPSKARKPVHNTIPVHVLSQSLHSCWNHQALWGFLYIYFNIVKVSWCTHDLAPIDSWCRKQWFHEVFHKLWMFSSQGSSAIYCNSDTHVTG